LTKVDRLIADLLFDHAGGEEHRLQPYIDASQYLYAADIAVCRETVGW